MYQKVDTDSLCDMPTSRPGSKPFPCFNFPCSIFLYSFPVTRSRVVHMRSKDSTCIRQYIFLTPSLNPWVFATNYKHHVSISSSEQNTKSNFLSHSMSIMRIYLCCFALMLMTSWPLNTDLVLREKVMDFHKTPYKRYATRDH